MKLVYRVVIPGRAYVKKNGAKVYNRRLVYTPQYRAWAELAGMVINKTTAMYDSIFPIAGDLRLMAIFYFENRQAEPDLSALLEGPQDVLQSCGVIKNDRQIVSFDGTTKLFGYNQPRADLSIYTLDD